MPEASQFPRLPGGRKMSISFISTDQLHFTTVQNIQYALLFCKLLLERLNSWPRTINIKSVCQEIKSTFYKMNLAYMGSWGINRSVCVNKKNQIHLDSLPLVVCSRLEYDTRSKALERNLLQSSVMLTLGHGLHSSHCHNL